MKFNWMHRYECSEDSKGLLQMVKSFEDHGVESVLLPYGSDGTDYFIHIPDFIKITKKINFMMAIRPYSVSPEYVTKSFKSMNNFEPNRLSINVVAGYFDSVEEDIVFKKYHREISEIDTSEKRVALCDIWIQKFIEIMNKDLPRIWMVGTSDKTIEIANKYATDFLVTQQLINENKINKIKAKKCLVINPIIKNSKKEALEYIYLNGLREEDTIFGSLNDVIGQVNYLSNKFNTDEFLIHTDQTDISNILHLVKYYKDNQSL
jgi:alkanesulfonate monooxygenase SsuD/methylene tetrahydromethanopterin reductase-like flavin-dependent oxidoreductase (luciferase family)